MRQTSNHDLKDYYFKLYKIHGEKNVMHHLDEIINQAKDVGEKEYDFYVKLKEDVKQLINQN